jgi:head-tail adaptor
MANISAAELDRRIQVFQAAETKDRAGDTVQSWDPPAQMFPRWAAKRDAYPREIEAAQALLREIDTVWTLRWDSQSRAIAPETFRFMWRGTVYEIVGIAENKGGRMDALDFTCSSRPDLRGARGRTLASGQP